MHAIAYFPYEGQIMMGFKGEFEAPRGWKP